MTLAGPATIALGVTTVVATYRYTMVSLWCIGDTLRSADADYKASVAADNSFLSESLGMEYVKSEPHVEVLGRWLNKQPIHVQLMVQAFGVTFGDDYAQVYMIVNKLMTNYNNNCLLYTSPSPRD